MATSSNPAAVHPHAAVLQAPQLLRAVELVRETDAWTLDRQAELTAIPAPPFGEGARGRAVAALFQEVGLVEVRTDAVGNVVGLRPGADGSAPVVLCAHLDTVFPEGTSVEVVREGDLLRAPGISDNGRGLAVLLAVARAVVAADVTPGHPLLFAATVGEEGAGDLRGARHLVGAGGAGHGAAAFLALDGAGLEQVVTRGLGSRRFRVTVTGPGGHSWMDRGNANPIHALAHYLGTLDLPPAPRGEECSFSAGRMGGGTSVNAIPQEAWLELDCRSTSAEHLDEMARVVARSAETVVAGYQDPRRGPLAVEVESIGARPAGVTDEEARVVRAARLATEAVGITPRAALSSTDANAAMAVGIPAVTLGGGGEADLAHTTREWYRNINGAAGVVRALYAAVLTAGLAS